ncbi:hypothetical protein J5N97_000536, partial [Dioscorea zingiberensis]
MDVLAGSGSLDVLFEVLLQATLRDLTVYEKVKGFMSWSVVYLSIVSWVAMDFSRWSKAEVSSKATAAVWRQLLERALEECGDDLDSAIRSLNELRLSSAANKSGVASEANVQPQAQEADWVELFVREMMSASNMDDAKARASSVLEVLEKSICSLRASTEAAQSFHQLLFRKIQSLKRAVSTQHERQKEYEDRGQELEHLKQVVVAQYQEQLRTLE